MLTRLQAAAIDALSQTDFESNFSVLSNVIVAAIIGRKPEFVQVLPLKRCGSIAALALDNDTRVSGIVESLREHGIPSDPIAVVNAVLDSNKESDVIGELDELLKKWQCPSGSDPVAVAMAGGNDRLDALFRSPWHVPIQSSGSRNDDNVWAHPLRWGSVDRAFASAVQAVPHHFRLELGFSLSGCVSRMKTRNRHETRFVNTSRKSVSSPRTGWLRLCFRWSNFGPPSER